MYKTAFKYSVCGMSANKEKKTIRVILSCSYHGPNDLNTCYISIRICINCTLVQKNINNLENVLFLS